MSSFWQNIPLIIFSILAMGDLVLFTWAGFILLIAAKQDPANAEKGKRALFFAFYGLFLVALVVGIFYAVSWFLQRDQISIIQGGNSEFPASMAIGFPPSPAAIKINGNYFNGPFSLKKNNVFKDYSYYLYAILCKNNQNYDTIYLNVAATGEKLLKNENYSCWQETCKDSSNLYIAVIWTPSEKYDAGQRNELLKNIQGQEKFPCPKQQ